MFIHLLGHSQTSSLNNNTNLVSFNAGGAGGYGALNYERIQQIQDKIFIGGKIGLSTIRLYDYKRGFNPDIIVPFSISVFYGNEHKIQLGIGQTLSNSVYSSITDGQPRRRFAFHSHLNMGYRFQKTNSRYVFGISYTPLLEFQKNFKHWGALMIGYTF